MQRVKLNARFVVNPRDRRLEGCDHCFAVFGEGKCRGDDNDAPISVAP
jgi:hypothetical protein